MKDQFAEIQNAVSSMREKFDKLVRNTNLIVTILQNYDSKFDRWDEAVLLRADKSKNEGLLQANQEKQEDVEKGSGHDSNDDSDVDSVEGNNVDTDKIYYEYTEPESEED
ncbi:hypothetical protein HOY80DRAFT_1025756 [Tuber brumale]|nr:hypothetical protein HOY80DRAFT_1025756 [Tuber brumale]